ncbi:hypothetical protein [Mycoplasma parvum]|uniref:Uncharacterized protein n=1 Tax=Mycoplasma parvum str. Indiana TaxID=1403316 RepID=U5NCD8_9MOLU|nr:hypothetical protein [Mycoplasma parvum]AGX88980.1 hypothetical protein PRV_01080 [Mycoplasma parvum str. Indiana]
MNLKNKLFIFSFLFVGVNLSIIPFLFSNIKQNLSSFKFLGGAFINPAFDKQINEVLNIGSNKVEQLKDKSLNNLAIIPLGKLEKQNLVFPSVETGEKVLESVQKISQEIEKEKLVKSIEQDYENTLKKAKSGLENSSSKLQKAEESFKNFMQKEIVSSSGKRTKRSTDKNEKKFSLSTAEREVLKNYYEQFFKLKEKQEELNGKLKEAEAPNKGTKSKMITSNNFQNYKKVLKALSDIGWEKELNWNNLFTQWKNKPWSHDNPFYFLLDQDIWKLWINSAKSRKEAIDEYLSVWYRRLCGVMLIGVSTCYPELEALKKMEEIAKSNVEINIVEKLLREMGRINS